MSPGACARLLTVVNIELILLLLHGCHCHKALHLDQMLLSARLVPSSVATTLCVHCVSDIMPIAGSFSGNIQGAKNTAKAALVINIFSTAIGIISIIVISVYVSFYGNGNEHGHSYCHKTAGLALHSWGKEIMKSTTARQPF